MTGSLRVIATAGHVDHGKSALIVALTGIDPDRFAEEKRRGLTIDLGYAWTTLPGGHEVGFVDVQATAGQGAGHDRAGAGDREDPVHEQARSRLLRRGRLGDHPFELGA